jgi:hypothetical protein
VLTSQGTFRKHSGNIQGTFREHSGNIQGTFREHSGNIQKSSGNIQETFREHPETFRGHKHTSLTLMSGMMALGPSFLMTWSESSAERIDGVCCNRACHSFIHSFIHSEEER